MRVLHVINSLPLAGAEILLRDLVPRLESRGVRSTVALLKSLDSPVERDLAAAGSRILPTPACGIYSAEHVLRLGKVMADHDLVHAHLFPSQLWVALAARLLRRRIALVTSEQSTRNRRRRRWLRPLDAWMFRQFDAILCPSRAVADSLGEWVPGVVSRLSIVPNGIALQSFASAAPAARAEIGAAPGEKVILFVARFDPAKDHATVIRMMAQLPGAHLALVGDGPLRPECERLAAELRVGDRVHFLGLRSDVASLLKMADVYVHSSHFEGFGIAALEAMAAGLPVVASDVPGLADLVRGAGILVPPQAPARMAEQVLALWSSPDRERRVADACRQRARQFSIERTADAFVEVYRRVLGRGVSA